MGSRETPGSPADIVNAGLLQHRHYIQTSLQSLSAGMLGQILQSMDNQRDARRAIPVNSKPIAEMSAAEMRREIMWRLQTLPSEDAEAIAALVRRLRETAQ